MIGKREIRVTLVSRPRYFNTIEGEVKVRRTISTTIKYETKKLTLGRENPSNKFKVRTSKNKVRKYKIIN